jgi:hypothetical protein
VEPWDLYWIRRRTVTLIRLRATALLGTPGPYPVSIHVRKVNGPMLDYTAVFTVIGLVALMFIPLYIPIGVTIVGAFRHWRQKSDQQSVRRPATRAAEVAQRRPRVSVVIPSTAAAPRSNQGVLPGAERPVAEAV